MTENNKKLIAEEARHWLVRLASGDVTEKELMAFKLWLARSKVHDTAFARERQLWQEASALESTFVALEANDLMVRQATQTTRKTASVQTASRGVSSQQVGVKSAGASARSLGRRCAPVKRGPVGLNPNYSKPFLGWALAACLLVVLVGTAFGPGLLVQIQADHHTGYDETARLSLPDGSRMTLNRNSAVEVLYSDQRRQVRLLSGEAFFEVAPNPQRPFQVLADQGVSQAVGTAYSVRRTDQGVRVAVTEGQVSVSTQQDSTVTTDLKAGQALRYEGTGEQGEVFALSEDIALAWRRDRLVFIKQSLSELLAILQNYHRGRLVVLAGNLEQKVSGTINLDSLDEGLAAVAATQNLKVLKVSPYLTIVR